MTEEEEAENKKSYMFKKMRRWEEEDKAEDVRNTNYGTIQKIRTLNSRLDMLLGFAIASLVFCAGTIILKIFGVV